MNHLFKKEINSPYEQLQGLYTGILLGSRLAYPIFPFLLFGIDVSYAPSLSYENQYHQFSTKNQSSILRFGPMLQLSLPALSANSLPLHLWLGYQWIDHLHDRQNAANNLVLSGNTLGLTTLKGHSFKLGISYAVWRNLQVQLEYLWSIFNTISSDIQSTGTIKNYTLPSTSFFSIETLSSSSWILSISYPLAIYF